MSERDEFEAWAEPQGILLGRVVSDERYESMTTEWAYRAWQAARAPQAVPALTEPVAWLHEIKEPEGHQMAMYSQFETNPWSHWVSAHLGQCEYKCSPLYPASAIAALEAERDALRKDAGRYRRIRNGPHSDRWGDVYAMTFQPEGDEPIHGEALDVRVDAAIAAKEPK